MKRIGACCLYCHEEFLLTHHAGQGWHDCPRAWEERVKVRYPNLMEYNKYKRDYDRRRKAQLRTEKETVYRAPQKYHCTQCGRLSINRFTCPDCLQKLEYMDLDAITLFQSGSCRHIHPSVSL